MSPYSKSHNLFEDWLAEVALLDDENPADLERIADFVLNIFLAKQSWKARLRRQPAVNCCL
jgi:hypothetical protein